MFYQATAGPKAKWFRLLECSNILDHAPCPKLLPRQKEKATSFLRFPMLSTNLSVDQQLTYNEHRGSPTADEPEVIELI